MLAGLEVQPSFPLPPPRHILHGAANIAAGSSLGACAPFPRKLRETTEGEKQSSADSWARCELIAKPARSVQMAAREAETYFSSKTQNMRDGSGFLPVACLGQHSGSA